MNERCLISEPFPPYTYVPGRAPHPVTDPRGHLFGRPHDPAAPLDPQHPHGCRAYLHGIDLFNAGYYWEAHEAWEAVWHVAGRTGPVGDFLKGLIKLAAAGVKAYEGRSDGVRRHARRAAELLDAVAGSAATTSRYAGVDLEAVSRAARTLADTPESVLSRADHPPVAGLLLTLALRPRPA